MLIMELVLDSEPGNPSSKGFGMSGLGFRVQCWVFRVGAATLKL